MRANKILTLILTLSMTMPAEARLVEHAENTGGWSNISSWQELKVVAKKEWNYWRARLTSAAEVERNVASTPASTPAQTLTPTSETASETALSAATTTSTPLGKNQEQTQLAEIIKQTSAAVTDKSPTQVSNPGRLGTTVLPKTKMGVPVFALTKKEKIKAKNKKSKKQERVVAVKEIPRLDIGLEKTISKSDFMPTDLVVGLSQPQKPKALPSPEVYSQKSIVKLSAKKLPVVGKAEVPKKNGIELGSLVSVKRIQDVQLDIAETKPLEQLKSYNEITEDDLSMITAVILFEKNDKCHMASGLLVSLADKKKYAEEANFLLGVCAHQMGFHSEAVSRLLKVINTEHAEYTTEAITNIVDELPREYDEKVYAAINGLKNKSLIADIAKDNLNFVMARAAHAKSDYSEAASYSVKVSEKSTRYVDARYIYGVALYAQKKLKESEQVLLALRDWMTKKNKSDKNIEALIAVNLARMRFTQSRYQAAHEEYMKVPKDHPLWVQALVEQGWTQLSVDDPEGAIGNMYSLHSPYFKSVFMPESWVVRTIGYIDICQYGDAYKTLTKLEQLHGTWLSAVSKYRSSKSQPTDYYTTVKNYIRGRSDQDLDGLPHQVIREIARQRGFLNAQGALNVLEDEISQYTFIYGILKKDQAALAGKLASAKVRLAKINSDLKLAKSNPEMMKNINEWSAQKRNEEQLVRSYAYQKSVYEESRKGFIKLRGLAVSRIERDKGKLRIIAGKELMSDLKGIENRISQIVEGNEFLRYEIFSGSGENIRYQVAGGSTADARRIPANIKPQKILNWEFDGEYWEDEIGSYRSTLKNNCPKNARAAQVYDSGVKTTAKTTAKNF